MRSPGRARAAQRRMSGQPSPGGSVRAVPGVRLLLRVPITVGIVDERVVATLAAEIERPSVVYFGGGGVLGPDLHAADGVLHGVGHFDNLLCRWMWVSPVNRPMVGSRIHAEAAPL